MDIDSFGIREDVREDYCHLYRIIEIQLGSGNPVEECEAEEAINALCEISQARSFHEKL